MRRWRVGTLSLGILLIALGVVLLVAQFKRQFILQVLLTWWPVVLVLLGGEILFYVFTAKEPEPKIKYDLFSIFFVAVMLFCSIGMYGLTATGMLDKICRAVSSSNMTVDVPPLRTTADERIKNIVVSAPEGRLEIKRSSTLEVTTFGQAVVNAADRQEAESLLEQHRVVMRREGDTLFIKYPATVSPGDFKPYIKEIRHTLLLPANIAVEINDSGNYFDLDLDGQAVGENWLIRGSGRINVTVAKLSDLTIDAYVRDVQQLCGSANWQPAEIINDTGNTDLKHKGTVLWGTGKNKLKILLENGEIKVDEI